MRTLKYIIIGLAICSTFSLQSQDKVRLNEIILKALEENKSHQELKQAADVLQKRLEIFGLDVKSIAVQGEGPRIVIQYEKDLAPDQLGSLATTTGTLGFYQTFTKQEVKSLFKNPGIAKLLQLDLEETPSAIVGKVSEKEAAKVNNYLKKLEKSGTLPSNLKFAWSKKVDREGKLNLYALKSDANGQALIDGQNLSEVSWKVSDETQENQIQLSFDEEGRKAFAEATKANIGEVIAVVIDQEVYLAPKIMSEITGGKLQITGDFDDQEAATLAAVLGGGELPFKLKLN